jgi:putative Mn2+ efflux pump MntP
MTSRAKNITAAIVILGIGLSFIFPVNFDSKIGMHYGELVEGWQWIAVGAILVLIGFGIILNDIPRKK